MKKLLLSFLVVSLFVNVSAQIDGFFPQFGQDAQWKVNDKFELEFTGAVTPAPAAAIATTFEGLVSDGIGGNDFTGLDISFDGLIIDAGTSTKVFIAYNGTWGEKAVNLEFNQWLCQAGTDYAFDSDITKRAMVTNFGAYQTAVKKNDYNKIEINVSASGLISCKVNGYVCDKPYQATLTSLKPTATNTFYVVFGNDIAGFKMKNLVATKGTTTNKYFYDPEASVKSLKESSLSMIQTANKAVFVLKNNAVGQQYQISNLLGQSVQSGSISNNEQTVNLQSVSTGTYFVHIKGEKAFKFIKN